MINVAVLDDYQNIAMRIIESCKTENEYKFSVFNEPFLDEDETISKLKNFDVLMVMRERTVISASLISSLKKLKLIITSGMQNKSIDLNCAKKNNILVAGTEMNSNPAAELTWALILGLSRNIKQESDNMFQGYWQTTIGVELKNKVLGILGFGKIGTQVAKIGKAFGMQVVAWSENLNLKEVRDLNVLPVEKDELMKISDFISIHLVLSDKYKNIITKKEFNLMKKTAYLINTSRGAIVNENDLIKALQDNKIAGAGLDVYEHEPLPQDHKLRFLTNTLLLPHVGYVTEENYVKMYSQMVENLNAFFNKKPIRLIK